MIKCRNDLILCCVFILFLHLTSYTYAQILDNIYLVKPPNNDGGMFYCTEYIDNGTKKYKREGYIPTMTLVEIETDINGDIITEFITEKVKGYDVLYAKFIGADGSYGWIRFKKKRKECIIKLIKLFHSRGHCLDDYINDDFIVPISPKEVVKIYDWDQNNSNKLGSPHTFSRTTPDIVLTNREKVFLLSEDGTERTHYYKVTYFKKNKRYEEQTALLEVIKENITYRIFPLNPMSYKKIKKREEENDNGITSQTKRFISFFIKNYDDAEGIKRLQKKFKTDCEGDISVKGEVYSGGNIPFLGGLKVSVGKGITLKAGYRFAYDCYQGFISGRECEVLKSIRCKEDSNIDHFARYFAIMGIVLEKKPFYIFRDDLIGEPFVKDFKKTKATGTSKKREKMFVLKKGQVEYFDQFAGLDKFFEDLLIKDYPELNTVQREQYKRFIIRLIVDCNGE